MSLWRLRVASADVQPNQNTRADDSNLAVLVGCMVAKEITITPELFAMHHGLIVRLMGDVAPAQSANVLDTVVFGDS